MSDREEEYRKETGVDIPQGINARKLTLWLIQKLDKAEDNEKHLSGQVEVWRKNVIETQSAFIEQKNRADKAEAERDELIELFRSMKYLDLDNAINRIKEGK